jgi:uncharacterized protein with HEPN domain
MIRDFTSAGREAFLSSRALQEATARCLEVMGEATRRISEATKRAWPKVPWEDAAELRNRLIHEYEAVDPIALWNSAVEVVPVFERRIGRIRLR